MSLSASTASFALMNDMEFSAGRFFSASEEMTAQPLVVLGFDVAQQLSPNIDALIDNEVILAKHRVKVIGILKKGCVVKL